MSLGVKMASVCDFNAKPKIEYPTFWEYKIFLDENCDEKSLVTELFESREFKLAFSKKNAKYKCFSLNLLVVSEKDRLEIFDLLKNKCKFVL